MWALQPAMRAQVNIEVNISGGTSAKSKITADQNSTFVASARSGRRSQVPSHVAQNSRAGILCAVHAVTEAHQTLICVQGFSNEGGGVITVLYLLDHREHACRCSAVEWATHGSDSSGNRRRYVGSGRCADPGGEGG
jgi:hypothetical protein